MATDVLKKASWLSANRVSVYLRLSTMEFMALQGCSYAPTSWSSSLGWP